MENQKQPPILFGVIFFTLVIATIVYKYKPSSDVQDIEVESVTVVVTELTEEVEVKKPKPFKPKYPHCVRNDSGELYDLVVDLVNDITTCDPTEKAAKDAQCPGDQGAHGGAIVVYTAVALLMVSLMAAAVEVYRHRYRPTPSSAGPANPRDPPQLSRRCSLADLTVLRHNRRESMLRRDSSMHMSFDGGNTLPGNGAHHQRVPLKLLGSSKSQDDSSRRGFIGTGKACKWQRSISADPADKADESIPDVHHHRVHMIRHH